jgi:AbrB family looped-hinge helix DNA binding protein
VVEMDVAITKMSSKGQIVIPAEMREGIDEGEKILLIKNDNQIILKKASSLSKSLEEDLAFARRTEEAMKRIEDGKGTRMDFDEFMEEINKW